MAALTTAQRAEIFAECMGRLRELVGAQTTLLKSEWVTLLAAADDFANSNAAAYNTSIPVAVRTKATSQEKALALDLAIAKRYIVGA